MATGPNPVSGDGAAGCRRYHFIGSLPFVVNGDPGAPITPAPDSLSPLRPARVSPSSRGFRGVRGPTRRVGRSPVRVRRAASWLPRQHVVNERILARPMPAPRPWRCLDARHGQSGPSPPRYRHRSARRAEAAISERQDSGEGAGAPRRVGCRAGRRCVAGSAKQALSAATMTSQLSATSSAPPIHGPSTAAMTGTLQPRTDAAAFSMASSTARSSIVPVKSARTTARTSPARPSARRSGRESTFRRRAFSMVTSSTPSRSDVVTRPLTKPTPPSPAAALDHPSGSGRMRSPLPHLRPDREVSRPHSAA